MTKKLYMFCGPRESAYDRVPRKVLEWAMRKKGVPDVLVRSVMSLYEGAKTRVRADSELSEELEAKTWMHQGSVLSPLLFEVMVDVVTEFAREGAQSELLYADDLVLMSETIDGNRDKFIKWKEAFESKRLKDNLGKTKVISSGISGWNSTSWPLRRRCSSVDEGHGIGESNIQTTEGTRCCNKLEHVMENGAHSPKI